MLCKLAAAGEGKLALQMVLRFASSAPRQIEGLLMTCTDPVVRDILQKAAQQVREQISAQAQRALQTAAQLEDELANVERSQSTSQVSLACLLLHMTSMQSGTCLLLQCCLIIGLVASSDLLCRLSLGASIQMLRTVQVDCTTEDITANARIYYMRGHFTVYIVMQPILREQQAGLVQASPGKQIPDWI